MNFAMSANAKRSFKDRPVSDQEMVRFLRHLSTVYNNEATGNPRMSHALSMLADSIHIKSQTYPNQDASSHVNLWEVDFKKLESNDVLDLLKNANLTKSNLVRIGLERFSISKSRLNRLTIKDIRSELLNAVMHEESIRILSQEAIRKGLNRVS